MTRALFAGAMAFALLSGCAHSSPTGSASPPPAAQAPGQSGKMMAMCPMDVPGTRVSAADTADGASLTFTGADQPAELQRRVHAMAEMHNRHHAGGMHEGMMDDGMKGGAMMPASHATVADLEGGASITLTPDAPADLQKVRSMVRMHAERMQQGGCAMMGHKHGG
jgi:hypothetical protein